MCIRSTGKRRLVFVSLIGCGVCFFIAATYTHICGVGITAPPAINESAIISDNVADTYRTYVNLNSRSIDETSANSATQWMLLFLLLGGSMFAHMGIKCVPWMLIGEVSVLIYRPNPFHLQKKKKNYSQVYPTIVRGAAAGVSSALGYLIGFLSNKLFLSAESTFTLHGTFWFYSGVAGIGCVILYFVLPETENKSLLEIEACFDKSKKEYLQQKRKLECESVVTS